MQYLALIYAADGAGPQPEDPEFGSYLDAYKKAGEKFEETGVMMGGNALEDTSKATSVRVRNGKVETMDGPFAETKEKLGGYYLFDCKDLDQAIEMAAMIPTADHGTIEIRPVMHVEFPD